MASEKKMRQEFAAHLLENNRMVVEPTSEMMQRFPLGIAAGDTVAWLKAVAKLLGDAVELRKPFIPSGEWKLAVKDRGVLFTIAEADAMEEMAKRRKANEDA
jgi:hypothetical protein